MKAHRVTLLVVDLDHLGAKEVGFVLERTKYPNHCISPTVLDVETAEIGDWNDEHPLNSLTEMHGEIDRLFPTRKP